MALSSSKSEIITVVILRITGVGGLFAIPAIFFPFSWMDACHEYMGLGAMPDDPIVIYLARSLSAFYAIVGMVTLYISFDIRRYRPLIRFWAMMVTFMGIVLLGIDLSSGMPTSWTVFEGPMTLAMGVVLLWSQRGIGEFITDSERQP